ncbi:hypothetical protein B4121_2214 [Bacillus paralicheniformis]|uniref:Uncharacterized protein n=1 Tax=Bacillus paralicheniformis TaxID=1648923 RepID=A0A7Z1B3T3_9BACI|nr:hypothetical protein B4121_2214 [Bacillus paralicheniformis]
MKWHPEAPAGVGGFLLIIGARIETQPSLQKKNQKLVLEHST